MERTNHRKNETISNKNDEFFEIIPNIRERLQQETEITMEVELEEFFRTEKFER